MPLNAPPPVSRVRLREVGLCGTQAAIAAAAGSIWRAALPRTVTDRTGQVLAA